VSFSDTDLIARVLAHEDHPAFGELVRRHQSFVRAFLARLVRGDAHLADDLAQETFLQAWQKLGRFRGEAKFSTWLLGIAYNQFRNAARRRKDLAWEDLSANQPEPAAAEVPPGLRLDLANALERLHPMEQTAILLCCQNGLSHEEAAQVLEIPIGTVKTHVLRGREKLKRLLSL
jgi:RNA polymerase sigma factor (sigma-70 family)